MTSLQVAILSFCAGLWVHEVISYFLGKIALLTWHLVLAISGRHRGEQKQA